MEGTKDPIQPYRQPMVTAIALILGFSVGFLADWATEEGYIIKEPADFVLLIGMTISTIALTWALLRILNMNYPRDRAVSYYADTKNIFVLGIAILFLCIFMSLLI